ncbi:hypothetical protein FN846DRAFT_964419 [Sphaerosporella brunnea]|uniref:Uncharacterized protein n=1 Tax=Sphaerosporella brunnea TaxID=1250544 RepID=A0A5J5ENB3_9PEZI|nr:hypothetical protein FN846DRAFT_964419 [Sphaerosporella brunnea]
MPAKKNRVNKGAKKDVEVAANRKRRDHEEDSATHRVEARLAALELSEIGPATPARVVQYLLPTATPVSLYAYLASFRPEPPSIGEDATTGANTRNSAQYRFSDIRDPVGVWTDFSLASCRARFGAQLRATPISEQPSLISPQKDIDENVIGSEPSVVTFLVRTLFPHLNRALRVCEFAERDRAGADHKSQADRVGITFPQRQVRLVGEVKVSWKWRSSWRDLPSRSHRGVEYRQVLSQVHSYMNAAGCRWGYVVTDREFVALQRGDHFGELHVAEAVPLFGGGRGAWTPALAAWYLYALAQAEGDDWKLTPLSRSRQGKTVDIGRVEAFPHVEATLRRSARVREVQARNEAGSAAQAEQVGSAGRGRRGK